MNELLSKVFLLQSELQILNLPSESTLVVLNGQVIPFSIIKGTRGYLEKITHQINGTYKSSCFDACAVMIRRLVETLIIESFEMTGNGKLIENPKGEYYFLKDLIDITVAHTWKISRNFKKDIQKLKDVGDKSAHSRNYTAYRQDIDDIIPALRLVTQELLVLSGIRK
jgi:Domain of unknown function (DUF4145)